jgi:hypothetical protein
LLKKWKRKINDQEFLKNYLQRRIEKREKRKQKKQKNLKIKLERLDNWLGFDNSSTNLQLKKSTARENTLTQKVIPDPFLISSKGGDEKSKQAGGKEATTSEGLTTTGLNNAFIDGILTLNNSKNNNTLSLKKIKTISFLKKENSIPLRISKSCEMLENSVLFNGISITICETKQVLINPEILQAREIPLNKIEQRVSKA